MKTYSSKQVVQLTGATPRQLQWWDEQGIISPEHKGHRRLYTLEEVRVIQLITALKRKGLTAAHVHRLAPGLMQLVSLNGYADRRPFLVAVQGSKIVQVWPRGAYQELKNMNGRQPPAVVEVDEGWL